MRVDAFKQVDGYLDSVVAGEEPELCVRLRKAGWQIWRIDREMTLHDAAITKFRQWWKRVLRSGHAYAEGMYRHGAPPERHCVRETLSALVWGAGVPLAIVCLAIIIHPLFLALLAIYGLQIWKCARRGVRPAAERWAYAFFVILGKVPESQGVIKFYLTKLLNRRSRIIEYK